jgi:hypothetical protein
VTGHESFLAPVRVQNACRLRTRAERWEQGNIKQHGKPPTPGTTIFPSSQQNIGAGGAPVGGPQFRAAQLLMPRYWLVVAVSLP